jgi:hypothetical protein
LNADNAHLQILEQPASPMRLDTSANSSVPGLRILFLRLCVKTSGMLSRTTSQATPEIKPKKPRQRCAAQLPCYDRRSEAMATHEFARA